MTPRLFFSGRHFWPLGVEEASRGTELAVDPRTLGATGGFKSWDLGKER